MGPPRGQGVGESGILEAKGLACGDRSDSLVHRGRTWNRLAGPQHRDPMLIVTEDRDVAEQNFSQSARRGFRGHRSDQLLVDLVYFAILEVALGIADVGRPQLLAHEVPGAGEYS